MCNVRVVLKVLCCHGDSFLSSAGNGFEAFITAECTLVVAVGTKKDYNTVAVVDSPLTDQNWVSRGGMIEAREGE